MNLYGLKQLIASIRTVRKNMIPIAEGIPEDLESGSATGRNGQEWPRMQAKMQAS